VRVAGEVDAYSAPEFRAAFAELEGSSIRFIVADLTQMPFIDSTGLGVLNGIRQRAAEAGGRLVGICNAPNVKKVFETTGFLQLIALFESEDEALEDIRGAKEDAGDA
jgi:anti-sigma B factor antagonist